MLATVCFLQVWRKPAVEWWCESGICYSLFPLVLLLSQLEGIWNIHEEQWQIFVSSSLGHDQANQTAPAAERASAASGMESKRTPRLGIRLLCEPSGVSFNTCKVCTHCKAFWLLSFMIYLKIFMTKNLHTGKQIFKFSRKIRNASLHRKRVTVTLS